MNAHWSRLLLLALVMALGLLGLPRTAHAASDPVVCSATLSTIDFGNVDPTATGDTPGTSSLSWNCKSRTRQDYYATVCFNIGSGPLGTSGGNRQISGPGGNLGFQIYTDAAYTQLWGAISTPANPNPVRLDFYIPGHSTQSGTIPVYARLFGGQSAATAGTYSTQFANPEVEITGVLAYSPNSGDCGQSGSDAGNFSPFTVSAKVLPSCTVTATPLDFGTINGFLTGTQGNSTVSVTCVNGTPYKVSLDYGQHASGSIRGMQGPGGQISYALYQDSGRTRPWGNSLGVDTVDGNGNGTTQNLPVFGWVPAQTTPSAGTYQDIVTVGVTY